LEFRLLLVECEWNGLAADSFFDDGVIDGEGILDVDVIRGIGFEVVNEDGDGAGVGEVVGHEIDADDGRLLGVVVEGFEDEADGVFAGVDAADDDFGAGAGDHLVLAGIVDDGDEVVLGDVGVDFGDEFRGIGWFWDGGQLSVGEEGGVVEEFGVALLHGFAYIGELGEVDDLQGVEAPAGAFVEEVDEGDTFGGLGDRAIVELDASEVGELSGWAIVAGEQWAEEVDFRGGKGVFEQGCRPWLFFGDDEVAGDGLAAFGGDAGPEGDVASGEGALPFAVEGFELAS